MPDILFAEELAAQHGYMLDMGLASVVLGEYMVMTVLALAKSLHALDKYTELKTTWIQIG